MNVVTVACLYDTLLNGKQFIIDLFTHIGKQEVLGKISMGQFSIKLVDGFFGVFTKRNQDGRLKRKQWIEDLTRQLSNYAFVYVQSCVSTDNKRGVKVKQFSTWIYSQDT